MCFFNYIVDSFYSCIDLMYLDNLKNNNPYVFNEYGEYIGL
jgi:hypothetical protein